MIGKGGTYWNMEHNAIKRGKRGEHIGTWNILEHGTYAIKKGKISVRG